MPGVILKSTSPAQASALLRWGSEGGAHIEIRALPRNLDQWSWHWVESVTKSRQFTLFAIFWFLFCSLKQHYWRTTLRKGSKGPPAEDSERLCQYISKPLRRIPVNYSCMAYQTRSFSVTFWQMQSTNMKKVSLTRLSTRAVVEHMFILFVVVFKSWKYSVLYFVFSFFALPWPLTTCIYELIPRKPVNNSE